MKSPSLATSLAAIIIGIALSLLAVACTPGEVQPTQQPTAAIERNTPEAQATATPAVEDQPLPPAPATSTPTPTPTPDEGGQEDETIAAARRALAAELGVDPDTILLTTVRAIEWRDGCLGIYLADQACTDAITPGYVVALEADSVAVNFHTNEDGSTIRRVPGPAAPLGGLAIMWQDDGQCQTAVMDEELGVAYGPCEGQSRVLPFSADTPQAAQELADFSQRYMPFYTETPDGSIYLFGLGGDVASAAEQQSLAEWARPVAQAAIDDSSAGAADEIALTWHREGGLAGFCDDLTVYLNGEMSASSCGGQAGPLGQARLTPDQLAQLLEWIETYQSFNLARKDSATADAMTIGLTFNGAGRAVASQAEQQMIQQFAADLYNSFRGGVES